MHLLGGTDEEKDKEVFEVVPKKAQMEVFEK